MRYLALSLLLLALFGCVTRVVVQPCQPPAQSPFLSYGWTQPLPSLHVVDPNFYQPYICNEVGCKPLREFTYNDGTAIVSPPAMTDVPK